jgi:NTE family protein
VGRYIRKPGRPENEIEGESVEASLLEKISEEVKHRANTLVAQLFGPSVKAPGMFDVLASSINIMQDLIVRSRMAGDPPELLLTPRLSGIGLLEFDRAREAIEEGRACVKRIVPTLEDLLRHNGSGTL